MKKIMKPSRAFFILLALLLVLTPISTLANTVEEEINYVALGDSLAAGLLSDGKNFSSGYVGEIEKSLVSNGYTVNTVNAGKSGFTTGDVLTQIGSIEALAQADVITLSAGANDLLGELDLLKIAAFDPEQLAKLQVEAENELKKQFSNIEQAVGVLNGNVTELEVLLGDITGEVSPIEDLLPEQVKDALITMNIDAESVKQNLNGASSSLVSAKEAFEAGVDFGSHLGVASNSFKAASTSLTEISSQLSEIESYLQNIPGQDDLIETVQQTIKNVRTINTVVDGIANSIDEVLVSVAKYQTQIEALEKQYQEIETMLQNTALTLGSVAENTGKIIGTIKQLNPDAKIYVMGYYNALPYFSPDIQEAGTLPLIHGLNQAIQSAATATGANYVPTFNSFVGNYETYLPNPQNIHPSEVGYQALASEFMKQINVAFPIITVPEEPAPSEQKIDLGKTVEVSKGQLIEINDTNVSLILPDDLPEGTTLTVAATNEDILAKAVELNEVGDVLNFTFQYPNGFEDYVGNFQLIMGFNHDSSDEVNIYYFNEENEVWESQIGEVNNERKVVTLNTSHFSNYGVFVKSKESEKVPPKKVDPNGATNGGNDKKGEKQITIEKDKKDSTTLPVTATNHYNLLLIGQILIGVATLTYIISRKRKAID